MWRGECYFDVCRVYLRTIITMSKTQMLTRSFSGLPPYHPLVIQQGHDPNGTEISLRESAAMAIEAGYNVRCELIFP